MNRSNLMGMLAIALASNPAALDRPIKRHYTDSVGTRNRREKVTGLPPVGQHANDTSIPAVTAAIAKRERKAKKLNDHTHRSDHFNTAHTNDRLNPFYIAQ